MPRCIAYTMISVAMIVAAWIMGLPDLILIPILLVHGALLLLDPKSLDFPVGTNRR